MNHATDDRERLTHTMNTGSDDRAQVAEAIAEACRKMASRELVVRSSGNVSVRVGDLRAITRTGLVFEEATPADVLLVDDHGNVVEGHGVPSSEFEIHRLCGSSRHGSAVVHTHSMFATTVSTLVEELPPVHYYLVHLGGRVAVAPYSTFGTLELAQSAAAGLGEDSSAVLLANHGSVARGATLRDAVDNAVLLEWLCQLYWRASIAGKPQLLSAQQLDDVRAMRAVMAERIHVNLGTEGL